MAMKRTGFLGLILILAMALASCSNNMLTNSSLEEKNPVVSNVFQDKKLQTITTFQDRRDHKRLISFFSDLNPVYRKAAALALASVQAPEAVEPLGRLLEDPDAPVRQAAAYALGQIGEKVAEPVLLERKKSETAPEVKRYLLEALGKCGDSEGLRILCKQNFPVSNPDLLIGQAMGLYRFGLRDIVSPQATAKALALLDPTMPSMCRLYAAAFLARSKKVEAGRYISELMMFDKREYNEALRMQLVMAIGNTKLPEAREYLFSVLRQPADYRVKVNCIGGLAKFPYETVSPQIMKQLLSPEPHVAIRASEYFTRHSNSGDTELYIDIAKKVKDWRAQANLLAAALKTAVEKESISKYTKTLFKQSSNRYQKAFLLKSLGHDPQQMKFIGAQVFGGNHKVISTYGMEALVEILSTYPETHRQTITPYLLKAIDSKDPALISLAAAALRKPELGFKEKYSAANIGFLTQAQKDCNLPRDFEAFRELQSTIDYFSGKTAGKTQDIVRNNPIDWGAVSGISEGQQVILNTTKGAVTIRLLVNEAPASVANFLRLMRRNYYNGVAFHRVVPNFVAQAGCPRGDGWGGPDFTIRSELGPRVYSEGCVGMASAGKDTEGSQWFITHSPTPHLDGRYTIFGIVESGMEVVHRLQVGDTITSYRIANAPEPAIRPPRQ
jgi:cyclophilin family peptidyl-prolyl cis-trans isomerase/HEAT repeat protein